MSLTPEQMLAAHKANIETLFGLTNKAFEGVEKLVELNLTASRAALTEAATHTRAVLSVKDAQELVALQASLFQPLAEKAASYSRHLYDIASGTSNEFGSAVQAKTAEAQKNFTDLVETASKNAPAGSETAVAVMKSAVSAANNAFESVPASVNLHRAAHAPLRSAPKARHVGPFFSSGAFLPPASIHRKARIHHFMDRNASRLRYHPHSSLHEKS